ncbi:MAG TPA: prepilin-type N-terminal cleavage/methylation domain-containing protein [Albitalea sp.]|nr:prepilin-type N-terminal cleavage/methylation domain-containing protein [Albitalea sp.]
MKSRNQGFTLIELMVVVVLIAIASALASLALRDPAATQLEQEGARLAALLEAARAEARASGLAVSWEPHGADPVESPNYRFIGLPSDDIPQHWLTPGVSADVIGARAVVLGPEPLIGPQRIVLSLAERRLVLATDGLGPFVVTSE